MYTQIAETDILELDELKKPLKKVIYSESKRSTAYFSLNALGISPRLWQYKFWKELDGGNKRLICVTSRQIGKSTAIAIFALKAAFMNLSPKGINKQTHIGIISATDEQSKKIMLEIRRIMQLGDYHVNMLTQNKTNKKSEKPYVNYFTKYIDDKQEAVNNKTTITFRNGNTIVCLPPTQRIRGYSFSYVFIDEAAFIENPDIFFQYIEPTTANTDGTIVMTTTPNGMVGWFYELFDPDNKKDNNPYTKFWFHYTQVEDPDYQKQMSQKKEIYYQTGREKEWQQEYDALFTSQVTAFFTNEVIDRSIKPDLCKLYHYSGECDAGLDLGMVHSRTVLTITTVIKDKVRLIYDFEYEPSKDINIVSDLIELRERFNIQRLIIDDCPESYYLIPKLEENGFNITKMSFKSEKIAKYIEFRKKLHEGKIELYNCPELIAQLKGLQNEETATTTKIHKGSGGRDDYPDSLLMSIYHYLDMSDDFSSDVSEIIVPDKNGQLSYRYDEEYDRLLNESKILGVIR